MRGAPTDNTRPDWLAAFASFPDRYKKGAATPEFRGPNKKGGPSFGARIKKRGPEFSDRYKKAQALWRCDLLEASPERTDRRPDRICKNGRAC